MSHRRNESLNKTEMFLKLTFLLVETKTKRQRLVFYVYTLCVDYVYIMGLIT